VPFINVDDEAVLKQLGELQDNVLRLPQKMPETFVDWQRDDMNRKFPNVEGGGFSISTMIYPRSRLTRLRKGKTGGKQARRRARVAAGRPGAKRPILRPELFDQLRQRMVDMLKEICVWP
jgi:hypothetical protein